MRVKTFVSASLKDATEQMRNELGPEAIILSTRKASKGSMLNFLGKELIEVTAAVEDQPIPGGKVANASFGRLVDSALRQNGRAGGANETYEGLKALTHHFEKREKSSPSSPAPSGDLVELRREVEEMRSVLAAVAEHMKYSRMPALPEPLARAFTELVANDVDEKLAADITQTVYGRLGEHQHGDARAVRQAVIAEIANAIPVRAPAAHRAKKPKIAALIGPTGVGKTTTIAKLAAIAKLVNRQSVGLISADTYRIGAIEQLRTFAGIADIPMEVVYKPSEIAPALRKFRGKDLVLIDTVGRNQKMKKEMAELKRFLEAADPDEVHLVIDAATAPSTLGDILAKFGLLKPTRLIFSKVDEAAALGSMLNIARSSKLPVSWLTTGQTVPDDIVAADAQKMAHMIYPGMPIHA